VLWQTGSSKPKKSATKKYSVKVIAPPPVYGTPGMELSYILMHKLCLCLCLCLWSVSVYVHCLSLSLRLCLCLCMCACVVIRSLTWIIRRSLTWAYTTDLRICPSQASSYNRRICPRISPLGCKPSKGWRRAKRRG
jgi:hypothetical protein